MKENISIHNYELFFIDYAEGNLSLKEMREVDHFIIIHPELKEEFEAIISFPIHENEEKIVAPASLKSQIKKQEKEIIPLRFHSLDEMMAAEIEDDLDTEEKRIFNLIISDNPDKLTEFELMKKCRLIPDEKIKFGSYSSLKTELIHGMPSRFKNFNEFAISGIENELSPDELKTLDKMISNDPRLHEEYVMLNACKFQADTDIHFPSKSSLKHKAPVIILNRRIWLPLTSVAAAALLIFFLLINMPKEVIQPNIVAAYSPPVVTGRNMQAERDDHRRVYFSSSNKANIKMQKNVVSSTHTKANDILENNNNPNESELIIPDNQNTTSMSSPEKSGKEKMPSNNYVIEKPESPSKATSNDADNSMNIDRYVVAQFRKKVLNEDPSECSNKKLSGWDLADAGVQRLGKWMNKDWKLQKEYDENGNVRQVAFNSQRISINSPVKQK